MMTKDFWIGLLGGGLLAATIVSAFFYLAVYEPQQAEMTRYRYTLNNTRVAFTSYILLHEAGDLDAATAMHSLLLSLDSVKAIMNDSPQGGI
ncbi:MAG: hypothetical protein Q8O19_06490 [Rectinemataceae bacterium]|nr:hypothetical protein [Rectinemataceae bacterium]